MVRPRTSPEATPILQLLSDYSFDVDTYAAEVMVTDWLQRFEPTWVSQAITEALYQGRYKLVSVDHILQIWQRRGQPLRHFNREFESIILGQSFNQIPSPAKPSPAPLNFSQEPPTFKDNSPQTDRPFSPAPAGDSTWTTPVSPSTLGTADASTLPSANAQPWEPGAWITAASVAATSDATTDETETASPTWPSSRTIPPLTPDQLARLTQPSPTTTPVSPEDTTTVDPPISRGMGLTAQESPAVESPGGDSSEAEPSMGAKMGTSVVDSATPSTTTTVLEDETTSESMGHAESAPPAEPIPNFQPITPPAGFTPESTDAIPPFVPAAGSSGFHQRLKAVVEAGLTDN